MPSNTPLNTAPTPIEGILANVNEALKERQRSSDYIPFIEESVSTATPVAGELTAVSAKNGGKGTALMGTGILIGDIAKRAGQGGNKFTLFNAGGELASSDYDEGSFAETAGSAIKALSYDKNVIRGAV